MGGHSEFAVLGGLVKYVMDYRVKKEIKEEERLKELQGMVGRDNHKLAGEMPKKLAKLLAKDVAHGFSIPVSPGMLEELKEVMVQPLGLAT